jgi:hypothetical protein
VKRCKARYDHSNLGLEQCVKYIDHDGDHESKHAVFSDEDAFQIWANNEAS